MVAMATALVALVALSINLLLFSDRGNCSPPPPGRAQGAAAAAAAAGRLVLEEGYIVTTLLDGNKLGAPLHPYALLPLPDSRRGDRLFLLDAAGSAFYALSLPVSQGSEIKRLSGNGGAGFSDGDTSSAMFKNPRSFAVDSSGNLYVADRGNFAIRKITASGMTTTIAGGYSQNKTGHVDGPAQNATFSNDFELVFVPKICALLVSDRGNRLIRQIILKPDDCGSESHNGLGTTSVSLIAVICVLLGAVLGFIAHSLYSSRKGSGEHSSSKTWKRCQTLLGTRAVTFFSGSKSAVARSAPFLLLRRLISLTLSYLFCMFRVHRKEEAPVMVKNPPSLLDSDATSNGDNTSNVFTDQLKDLIGLDGGVGTPEVKRFSKWEDEEGDIAADSTTNLDEMIRANILEFTGKSKEPDMMLPSSAGGLSLLKQRRTGGVDGA